MEIRLPRLDAVEHLEGQGIAPGNCQINGQPDPDVRAHGRVHRDQTDLQGLVQIRVVANGPIQDGLAVFVFSNLEIGGIRPAADEVAG